MALIRFSTLRWGVLFFCLILGTWLGVFLQRFDAISAIFADFVNLNADIRQVDLVMLKFGFSFAMRLNLGTIVGGMFGAWTAAR